MFVHNEAALVVNRPGAPAPVISGVTASVAEGGTLTIDGSNMDGVVALTIGGEDRFADIATQGAGQITLPVSLGGLPFGTTTVQVGNGIDTDSDTFAFTTANHSYVNVVDPVTTEDSIFYNSSGNAPATGMQYELRNDGGLTNLSGAADGVVTADTTGDYSARVWDNGDSTWGSWATFTISAADPFTDQGAIGSVAIAGFAGTVSADIPFTDQGSAGAVSLSGLAGSVHAGLSGGGNLASLLAAGYSGAITNGSSVQGSLASVVFSGAAGTLALYRVPVTDSFSFTYTRIHSISFTIGG